MQADLTFSDVALFGALVAFTIVLLLGFLIAAWMVASAGFRARLRRLQVARDESTGRLDLQLQLDAASVIPKRSLRQRFWDLDKPEQPAE